MHPNKLVSIMMGEQKSNTLTKCRTVETCWQLLKSPYDETKDESDSVLKLTSLQDPKNGFEFGRIDGLICSSFYYVATYNLPPFLLFYFLFSINLGVLIAFLRMGGLRGFHLWPSVCYFLPHCSKSSKRSFGFPKMPWWSVKITFIGIPLTVLEPTEKSCHLDE